MSQDAPKFGTVDCHGHDILLTGAQFGGPINLLDPCPKRVIQY
jgi:hypothetical protein